MATRLDNYKARQAEVSAFGKNLARRASSKCELCEEAGVRLTVFEVPPVPVEPEYERCTLICDTCKDQIERPKSIDPLRWRCLGQAMWSEQPPVQVMAIRLLKHLAAEEAWAADLLDQAYLEPEIEEWINEATI
ncbi:MAG: phnA protein [Chloroflexota bacterium]